MKRFARPTLIAVLAAAATTTAMSTLPATSSAAPTACTAVDVVTARGTLEGGTLGTTADAFYAALKKAKPSTTFSAYKVDYPAGLSFTSAGKGNIDLVNHVTEQAAACPDQKFVLMGFSQGANVVGNSIGTSSAGALTGGEIKAVIPPSIEPRIAAVVLFGYPNNKRGVTITGTYASRTDNICSTGDIFCDPKGSSYITHVSYGSRGATVPGAEFAAARI